MPLKILISTHFKHYNEQSIINAASIYENEFPVSTMSCLKLEIFIWKNSGKQEEVFQSLLLKHFNIAQTSCQT